MSFNGANFHFDQGRLGGLASKRTTFGGSLEVKVERLHRRWFSERRGQELEGSFSMGPGLDGDSGSCLDGAGLQPEGDQTQDPDVGGTRGFWSRTLSKRLQSLPGSTSTVLPSQESEGGGWRSAIGGHSWSAGACL